MFGDPKWLGKYQEYIREFQLQEAPAFNLDGKHRLPASSLWRALTSQDRRARALNGAASLWGTWYGQACAGTSLPALTETL